MRSFTVTPSPRLASAWLEAARHTNAGFELWPVLDHIPQREHTGADCCRISVKSTVRAPYKRFTVLANGSR